ncbi:MAG: aldo/keto reductase [Trueperaceae bacterium]|nr:aldo/keto reductase [Trueperaceae bacterium]
MQTILHHGSDVAVLGLGTWQMRGDACTAGVERALALGYRHIDTAQGYLNEAEVGEGMRRSGVPRDDVFLTTKLRPRNFRKRDVIDSTHESLTALGVETVDLLLMHWPNPEVPLEETLGAMRDLRDRGAIRHIGVSNFPPSLAERACELTEMFTNQVEYHPYLSQGALLRQAERLDYLVTAYSPLAQGRAGDDVVLQEIGAAHHKTPGQVALRWLIQQAHVLAIPKAASADNQRANIEIFDFELSEEEMAAVAGLDRDERLTDDMNVDWER